MRVADAVVLYCVVCWRLYNKEAILEFLLDRSKLADGASRFAHLRGLRVCITVPM